MLMFQKDLRINEYVKEKSQISSQYLPYSVTDGLGGILAQEYVARKAHLHRVLGDEGKIPETTQQHMLECEIMRYLD